MLTKIKDVNHENLFNTPKSSHHSRGCIVYVKNISINELPIINFTMNSLNPDNLLIIFFFFNPENNNPAFKMAATEMDRAKPRWVPL